MAYIVVSALSHTGLQRDRNEDSLVVGPWTLCSTVTESPQTLLFPLGTPLVVAVADGLGGHPAGEVASAMVVRRLSRIGPDLDSEEAVRDALEGCNRAVYAAADDDPDLIMMGTTVAGVVVTEASVLTFNVGDSRVYAMDGAADEGGAAAGGDGENPAGEGGALRELSVDDNPPLAPGQRTTAVVTQTLGGTPDFTPVEPHVSSAPLAAGTRHLVCTDGLTDPVPDDALGDVLREHADGRAAFEMWKSAMDAGGPDNITLAVIRIGE
ncbi:PP2C family protein-serine/threonine phosphatase [Streptomyces pathocidini]|uniref:PP2C family protein-serine/threonine phosphatase n=1 Tax=Streptomyces pathocidini TaxID=1650571 RepID=A0ABW7UNA8_9ACTN|nr:protein phosphatase 2C domain-containing protein [Streptomyces pathocidini]